MVFSKILRWMAVGFSPAGVTLNPLPEKGLGHLYRVYLFLASDIYQPVTSQACPGRAMISQSLYSLSSQVILAPFLALGNSTQEPPHREPVPEHNLDSSV